MVAKSVLFQCYVPGSVSLWIVTKGEKALLVMLAATLPVRFHATALRGIGLSELQRRLRAERERLLKQQAASDAEMSDGAVASPTAVASPSPATTDCDSNNRSDDPPAPRVDLDALVRRKRQLDAGAQEAMLRSHHTDANWIGWRASAREKGFGERLVQTYKKHRKFLNGRTHYVKDRYHVVLPPEQ